MESSNNQTALGMVETYGYIAHIEAADACLKAANVRLIGSENVKGGLMLINITGDVGAVKAAVDAARGAVERLGLKVATHVIPRPSHDIHKLIFSQKRNDATSAPDAKIIDDHNVRDDSEGVFEKIQEEKPADMAEKAEGEDTNIDEKTSKTGCVDLDADKLSKMNVGKLRVIARSMKDISLNKNQINFGKKQELITAIIDCLERRGK